MNDDNLLPAPAPSLPVSRSAVPSLPLVSVEELQAARRAGVADNTLRAYERALGELGRYCAQHGLPSELPLPPATVESYLYALATTPRYTRRQQKQLALGDVGPPAGNPPARSTIEQHAAAIAWWHRLADHPSPTQTSRVRLVLEGIWRTRAGDPMFATRKKKAALPVTVGRMVEAAKAQPNLGQAARDPALLLVLFSHGLRRSEAADIQFPAHVDLDTTPATITIARSKTDQHGVGRQLPLLHPAVVEAVQVWLDRRGRRPGPLFVPVDRFGRCRWEDDNESELRALTPDSVARIVKRLVEAIGVDPTDFAAHSLRRGFVTNAYRKGVDESLIQKSVDHKMSDTTRGYREEGLLGDEEEWAAHMAALEGL